MGDLFGLIVAGGAGTRLWPVSREETPKQLMDLSGSGYSLLQEAFLRLSRLMPAEAIHIVTSRAQSAAVGAQIQALANGSQATVLSEPEGRDSAPAVLWGALRIAAKSPNAVAVVVWSDQAIGRSEDFHAALSRIVPLARGGGLYVVGVKPTRPASNLGYIRQGAQVAPGVFKAAEFVEKPEAAKCQRMLAEGGYVWNPGIFAFHVPTLLEEFARYSPVLTKAFRSQAAAARDWTDPEVMRGIYAQLPRQSLDYEVLEKTERLFVAPAELDWSDLGAWDELYRRSGKDGAGNAFSGNVAQVGSKNCLVRGGRRLIGLVGAENLIVVDTDDALLICDVRAAAQVKSLVDELKRQGRPEVVAANRSERPWGAFTVLLEGEGFKVKELEVKPGQKLSLQMHRQRAEHWVVTAGHVVLTRGEEQLTMGPNSYLHIPVGVKHRIHNQGDTLVRIIEVQCGPYLGEDDIVRIEDVYGRV